MEPDTPAQPRGTAGSIQLIPLEHGTALGLQLTLGKAPLLVVAVTHGYVMCGYLNMDTANNLGDCAGRAIGVTTFDALLQAPITAVSAAAKARGLNEGITARAFLNALVEKNF